MDTISKLLLVIRTIVNFPTAIFDKFRLVRGEIIYKVRNKNLKFIARAATEDMAEIVVVASGFEYDMGDITLTKNPIVVDLGGHIGTFSITTARLLKDKCSIYVYEPDADNYQMLLRNIKLNNIKSVYPENKAISDHAGKGYLKKENMNTDAYYLDPSIKKISNCTMDTLFGALKKHKVKKIDLLKIDIEGGEYRIFLHKESYNYVKKNVHYIFMEYHYINSKYNYKLIEKMIKQDFRVVKERKNILTLENLNW